MPRIGIYIQYRAFKGILLQTNIIPKYYSKSRKKKISFIVRVYASIATRYLWAKRVFSKIYFLCTRSNQVSWTQRSLGWRKILDGKPKLYMGASVYNLHLRGEWLWRNLTIHYIIDIFEEWRIHNVPQEFFLQKFIRLLDNYITSQQNFKFFNPPGQE